MISPSVCVCPSECRCWDADDQPDLVLACGCLVRPERERGARHVRPTGCRYDETAENGWRRSWPGVDGAVMVCLTHWGRAPWEAYNDPLCTLPCLDAHLYGGKPPRPRNTAMKKETDVLLWAARQSAAEGLPPSVMSWLTGLAVRVQAGEMTPRAPRAPR